MDNEGFRTTQKKRSKGEMSAAPDDLCKINKD